MGGKGGAKTTRRGEDLGEEREKATIRGERNRGEKKEWGIGVSEWEGRNGKEGEELVREWWRGKGLG